MAKRRKRPTHERSPRNIDILIDEKLDRLLDTTDGLVKAVQKHAETLAAQNVILADHIRRTEILEQEVTRLNGFRNKLTAIVAFVLALSTLATAIIKIWL